MITNESRQSVRTADMIRAAVASLLDKDALSEWRRLRREADLR